MREDRLAGAGLARQHVQAPGQPQLRLLDQQEVLDTQLCQHREQVYQRPGTDRRRRGWVPIINPFPRRAAGFIMPGGAGERTPGPNLDSIGDTDGCQRSQRAHGSARAGRSAMAGSPALAERLAEEVARAERDLGPLSCLLVVIEDLDSVVERYGDELAEQALAHLAQALRGELRVFDQVGRPSERELIVLLPGADGPRGRSWPGARCSGCGRSRSKSTASGVRCRSRSGWPPGRRGSRRWRSWRRRGRRRGPLTGHRPGTSERAD